MKNYLVIGSGKGIGLKSAELLREQGNVYAVSRSISPELEALGVNCIQMDVAKDSMDLLNALPETLHGLVYCPGSINLKPFQRLSAQDFLSDFQQNVIGAVSVIQKVLPSLKKAGGSGVVLFSTVAVASGMPFHASIAASKGAVEGLAKSLAAELAASQIRVNVIAPSLTDTPLAGNLLNTPEKKEAAGKRHPLQRVGTPEDMAKLTCFLVGDESSWITGQVIGVDGGLGNLRV
jgi:NAD(P)-dependent dehydrogenase (short-subunit alcohol dehydrogenase family)